MGPLRAELSWLAVADALAVAGAGSPGGGSRLRVVDLGGGTGTAAVRIAGLGHDVTVVDPSPDALAALGRRATDAGVSIVSVLGDAADLVEHGPFDLCLCHGVLEHVDRPAETLAALAASLAPSGVASVVVPSRVAAATARASAGEFADALRLVSADPRDWEPRRDGPRSYLPAEIDELLESVGFTVIAHRGARVFHDQVPSSIVDVTPGGREQLFALELAVRERPEFCGASTGLQTLARLE